MAKYYYIPKVVDTYGNTTAIYLGVKCFQSPYPPDPQRNPYGIAFCGALPQAFGGNNDNINQIQTIIAELQEESRGVITLPAISNNLFIGGNNLVHQEIDGYNNCYFFYSNNNYNIEIHNNWPANQNVWENPNLGASYRENCAVVKIPKPQIANGKSDIFRHLLNYSNLFNNYNHNLTGINALPNPNYIYDLQFANEKNIADRRDKLNYCLGSFFNSGTFKAILKAFYETDEMNPGDLSTNDNRFNNNNLNNLIELLGAPQAFNNQNNIPPNQQENNIHVN